MLIESGGTLFSPTSCSCESSAANLRLRSALGDEHEGDQARAVITKTQTSHKEERVARVARSKESSFVHLWQHAVRGATVLAAFLRLKKERRQLRAGLQLGCGQPSPGRSRRSPPRKIARPLRGVPASCASCDDSAAARRGSVRSRSQTQWCRVRRSRRRLTFDGEDAAVFSLQLYSSTVLHEWLGR